jgi:hypothetical protein
MKQGDSYTYAVYIQHVDTEHKFSISREGLKKKDFHVCINDTWTTVQSGGYKHNTRTRIQNNQVSETGLSKTESHDK